MALFDKVAHGISWTFASRISSQVLQALFSIFLARLLGPREVGMMGMLAIFIQFAQILADGGLNSALIHNQQVSELHRSTAHWIQLGVGAGLSAIFYFGAPLIAMFYGDPELMPLTQVMSCIFLIQAFGYTHYALLRKDFQFRSLAINKVVATLLSGIVAVALALHGYGVWALLWQSLTSALITTGLLWLQSPWRPRFLFDVEVGAELRRYGIYLLGDQVFTYFARAVDNLLIGKYLGAYQLGIYDLSYRLMTIPILSVASVVGDVIFPALVQVQNDLPRFRRSYITAVSMIAFISFPLMIGAAILSEPLILFVLGEKWAEVVPLFRVLSLVGLFQSIIHPLGWIFMSLGKTKPGFIITVIIFPTLVIAVVIGLQYGILGVAYAYAIWSLFTGLFNIHMGGRYIGLTVGDMLKSVARIAFMAGAMGVVVFGCDVSLSAHWSHLFRLLIGVPVGMASYLALCLLTKDSTFTEVSTLAMRYFRGPRVVT